MARISKSWKIGCGVMGVAALCGIAALVIHQISGDRKPIVIRGQDEVYQAVKDLIRESKTDPEKAAQLKPEILKVLLDNGKISQEEYDARMDRYQKKMQRQKKT